MKNYKIATGFVTVYLVVYIILFQVEAPIEITAWMFVLSPFLVVWLAYTILRYGAYDERELRENEEWGYQDKPLDWGKNS